ncbi:MAG: response regulator transcription factor [Bdellovibrionales bacterium]|nr:response regulator transcription factor [Bdellovibrionales bacterium]
MKNILLIEDSPEIQMLVRNVLGHHNVVVADNLKKAKEDLAAQNFSLIILDIELPDGDGIEFLTELSATPLNQKIPVFILTSHADISRKISAFSLGVEDFIAKPFDPREIRARVDAKLRKKEEASQTNDTIRLSNIVVNTTKQKTWIEENGENTLLQLTSLEFKLLSTFIRNPEKVFSREFLIGEIWGSGTNITDRTVDTHVYNLRKKLSGSLVSIETVIGEGYRMIPMNPQKAINPILVGNPVPGNSIVAR